MKYKSFKILLTVIVFFQFSCKKFITVDPPKDKLTSNNVFISDELATSALTSIYSKMSQNMGNSSASVLCGLTADEFKSYSLNLNEFYENQITPISTQNNQLYSVFFSYIYIVNSLFEETEKTNNLTPAVKNQLQGEASFIRAFCYFYLVNIYGPVPLQLTTDYRITRLEGRAAVTRVYDQIINDLKNAERLLTDTYYTNERVRPNLAAVQALLARTYLYLEDWENAEKYATLVIQKSKLYDLPNLENTFIKNSQEAIWQLFPPVSSGNAMEGAYFTLVNTPTEISLNKDFFQTAFEANDKRKIQWVGTFTNNTGTYYFAAKYKLRTATPINEYSMIMRLAEQYLIRAEARTQQNNLNNAIDDLDKIRKRAGISLIRTDSPGINKEGLLQIIQKERRVELFSEWGHRWFDLKRTGKLNEVLKAIKPQWQSTDALYPIPYDETSRNPNTTQNDGY